MLADKFRKKSYPASHFNLTAFLSTTTSGHRSISAVTLLTILLLTITALASILLMCLVTAHPPLLSLCY